MPDQGLYSFNNEHDACGVGMVADLNGTPAHRIVEMGVKVLERLMHRGAAGSDPETGDGAGVYLQLPDEFFRKHIAGGAELPPAGEYGVGMFFLPREHAVCDSVLIMINRIIAEEGGKIEFWRKVEVDPSCIGNTARLSLPDIRQCFVTVPGLSGMDLERKLYVIRRMIEKRFIAEGHGDCVSW